MFVFGISAVVMTIPEVAINALYMTLGFALPLIYGATVFMYSACFFPFIITEDETLFVRALSFIVSIGLLLALAYGPNLYAKRMAKKESEKFVYSKINFNSKLDISSIEIRRKVANDGIFLGYGECGFECFFLLQKGQVDWIKVVVEDSDGLNSRFAPLSVFYFSKEKACFNTSWNRKIEKRCFVKRENKVKNASIVLKFKSENAASLSGVTNTKWYTWLGWKSVEVLNPSLNGNSLLYEQTEAKFRIVSAPFIVGPQITASNSDDLVWNEETFRVNPVSLITVLNKLGLNIRRIQNKKQKFKF